uniref:hypothetical protein n=1 Tax=Infirmifilum uzonense TaxID=1550241 RepID=UPI001F42D4EA|nr:hypothetical protein [Infirmifilum uzonense]
MVCRDVGLDLAWCWRSVSRLPGDVQACVYVRVDLEAAPGALVEALEAYSRALSLAGGLNLHPGESRAMQAWQVDHAGRAYHALSEAVEEVNIRRTRITPSNDLR